MEKGKSIVTATTDENGRIIINTAKIKGSIDRHKVRILLMDTNVDSCQEILAVLCQCSYQVTPVWQAPEVHQVLSFTGPEVDIILAEARLLMANNANMLRFIMHSELLSHIPVIMLSTQEDIAIVMKGLKLGAVDYLMKPLHASELSTIWMHTQKR